MIKLKNILRESKDKVFVKDGSLWVSYNPGSGKTTPYKDKMFITSKRGDSHFDSNAIDIEKWSKTNRAVFKNKISRVHKIPVYSLRTHSKDLSVWGGETTPSSFLYMLVATETNGNVVVSFFKTTNEVKTWLKQQSRG